MAFLSKVRGALQHTIGKKLGGDLASAPALYQAVRCMSSKIFVGGLSYQTTEDTLRETCEKYGAVVEARIIYDRETNNSRGFGFITFESDEAANAAIMALDGKDLEGRRLKVNEAHDRAQRGSFGGGGGFGNFGGGGGYNQGGGGGYYQGGGGGYYQGGGGGYNQGGGGGYNQGGGGGYNQGGGGGYNQGGGYDNQAGGGYNVQANQGGSFANTPSYPSTDFGAGNGFGGDSFNAGNVDAAPGLSNDIAFDGEDDQQERRAS